MKFLNALLINILFMCSSPAFSQSAPQRIDKLEVKTSLKLPAEDVSKALYLNADGQVRSSALVDASELSNLDGSTENIQDALDSKESGITATTSADYFRGDKTFQPLNKAAVGLPNVDNTTDLNKAISTATQTALNLKADDSNTVHKTGNENIAGEKTFTDPLVVTSTTKGSGPCPVMTDAQMLAIVSPQNGRCVYNSTKKAPYYYSSTDVKWKLAGGGGGAGGGIELMIDPSFEDGVVADYTGISGATASQIASTLPGTFNEKMLRLSFTSTGSFTVNKTTGAGFTGTITKVGGYFKPATQADVTFEPLINGVWDGRSCALAVGVWTYCSFEIPSQSGPGWRLSSPTATTHTVDAEWTTISVSEKFSSLVNLNQSQYSVVAPSATVSGSNTYTGAVSASKGEGLYSYNSGTGIYTALRDFNLGMTVKGTSAGSSPAMVRAIINGNNFSANMIPNGAGAGWEAAASWSGSILAGQTFYGMISNGTTSSHVISVLATAQSQSIVTSNETFSTDTAPLHWSSTICSQSDVGCFNTYWYAANTNNKTLCLVAPTQTIASMNANGFYMWARAYNGGSIGDCAGAPQRFEVVLGKGFKGVDKSIYKTVGKVNPGQIDAITFSTAEIGLFYKTYEASTGVLVLDSGICQNTLTTTRIFQYSDATSSSYGYVTVNASKNPAMTGVNVGIVASRGVNSSAQSIPSGTTTTLLYDAIKTIDTNGSLNSATGIYTAQESGLYQVRASILFTNSAWAIGQTRSIILLKNGSSYSWLERNATETTVNDFYGVSGSDILFLNKGETVSIGINHNKGTAIALHNDSFYNYVSINKINIGN